MLLNLLVVCLEFLLFLILLNTFNMTLLMSLRLAVLLSLADPNKIFHIRSDAIISMRVVFLWYLCTVFY